MLKNILAVTITLCALIDSAQASPVQDVTFAPVACPLSLSFPEAPIIRQKCDAPDQCTESAEYAHVMAADSRIVITANCSSNLLPEEPPDLKKMQDSLVTLLVSPDLITEYKTNGREHDFARQAELIGMGTKDGFDFLRVGQLWIGKNWVYSVTADLTGSGNNAADDHFFTILSSIKKQGTPTDDHSSRPAARTP